MRKKYLLLLFFSLPLFIKGQNLPQCDSLIINCCGIGTDSITLDASNSTTVLFDYPGFVLLDSNNDTIAKESVNYFGIGGGPQTHYMIVVAPLVLPFNGTLQLYSLFYDSLDCTWPVTIADTATGINDNYKPTSVTVFPNPFENHLTIKNSYLAGNKIQLIDLLGRKIVEMKATQNSETLNLEFLPSGIYFLEMICDGKIAVHTIVVKR